MYMKLPFVTADTVKAIAEQYPTPFHLYDEGGIRERARRLKQAFAWNPGFREYFAVKATPNPFILKILQEEGCGVLTFIQRFGSFGAGTDAYSRKCISYGTKETTLFRQCS